MSVPTMGTQPIPGRNAVPKMPCKRTVLFSELWYTQMSRTRGFAACSQISPTYFGSSERNAQPGTYLEEWHIHNDDHHSTADQSAKDRHSVPEDSMRED